MHWLEGFSFGLWRSGGGGFSLFEWVVCFYFLFFLFGNFVFGVGLFLVT